MSLLSSGSPTPLLQSAAPLELDAALGDALQDIVADVVRRLDAVLVVHVLQHKLVEAPPLVSLAAKYPKVPPSITIHSALVSWVCSCDPKMVTSVIQLILFIWLPFMVRLLVHATASI